MRALKVAALLVLVLAAMRATSWILQWMLSRLARIPGSVDIVSGNLAAFALFSGFLWWNRVPGEPMDLDAVLFGLIVFGLFGTADFFWTPLKRRSGAEPGRGRRLNRPAPPIAPACRRYETPSMRNANACSPEAFSGSVTCRPAASCEKVRAPSCPSRRTPLTRPFACPAPVPRAFTVNVFPGHASAIA